MDVVPLRLTNKRHGDLLVPLGKKLTSKPFEGTPKRHWKASMNATDRCVFIMEEVEWASLTGIKMGSAPACAALVSNLE